jgi:hypothetical protein
MKIRTQTQRGSAMITVIMLCGVMALLAGSMLRYSVSERRGNERNRLTLRAKNQAENVAVYAAEQLSTKLYRIGSAPKMKFLWTGSGSKRIYPPPDSVLNSLYTSAANVEVRAGIESASPYTLVEDTTDPNFGLQVSKARVPIIAKATATHGALGSITSYVEQDMEIALTPLFQFGMFYNMDLELYPSVAFTMAGPVHSNKRIMAKPDGAQEIAITFLKRVTCAQGLYADATFKAFTRGADGVLSAPKSSPTDTTTTGDVIFYKPNNTAGPSLKNSSKKWRDHKFTTAAETTTTIANFRAFTLDPVNYNGNVRTSAHGVTALELPGVGTYQETDNPSTTDIDERNNGRQIIEPPNPQKWNGTSWVATTDGADEKQSKIAYKAGLYLVVNPDYHATPRSAILPDETTVWVRPNSYRAFLNYLDASDNRVCTEVVLPGQPSYGYNAGADGTLGTADDLMYRNYFPNRYTEQSVGGAGTGNQLLRIPQGEYDSGTGYKVNGNFNTIGATTLAVDSGTGRIVAGEVIRIGTSHRYVVAEDYLGGAGNLQIMPPGILATVADNSDVTVEPTGLGNVPSPAYKTYKASGSYDTTTTKIELRLQSSGTGGAIIPGSIITIGTNKYMVTAAPASSGITSGNYTTTSYTIGVARFQSSVASNVNVTIDATAPTALGTGLGHRLSSAGSGDTLALGTGAGTIGVGDVVFTGGKRFLVVGTDATSTIQIFPSATTTIPSGSVLIVDPYRRSGYSRSTVWPAANTGIAFPTDNTAPYVPADGYFFDMRRANSNRGVVDYATPTDARTNALYNRFAVPYNPRAVAKVDFDMVRLRMMVNRVMSAATTSNIYDVRAPTLGGVWNNSIFNASGVRANFGLGLSGSFNVFPTTTDINTSIRPDPYNVYYAPTDPENTDLDDVVDSPMNKLVPASAFYNDAVPDAWYDGVAVYLHSVDAEKRAQTSGVPNRVDSGVRLWNGRGPVISLGDATKTGFTFVTNDPVYIMGHFNADGNIDSASSDTGTGSPNFYGGYSAAYADGSEEMLCAVMGDSFTAISQPTWTSATSGQAGGWNDAFSGAGHNTPTGSWRTGASATSALNGNTDGVIVGTAYRAGLLPNQNYSDPATGTARSTKFAAGQTEMSTALLMGIVPSNHDPRGLTDGYVPSSFKSTGTPAKEGNGVNSGGANNFPRLLEAWGSSVGLYIRGSIVALYESRVAMEPFTNSRCYGAPGRYWGLHYKFSQASHDVPLEPIVIGSNRVGFRELSAADYAAKKTIIEALP